jgi:signal transduction histidine kinase
MLDRLGMKREEVIGQPCYKITHRQDSPCSGEHHPCPLIQTLETEEPSQTTHIHHDKDNREIYYSISTYPLIENDDVIGAIEISRDITKDIAIQKVMMQQEKLASIGRLSAGVAHEINNPLTTILTTAMLIQEDIAAEDPMNEELETIANEALRCRKIVSSLLDFARQKKPKKEINDINKIIDESILLINKQAAFNDVVVDDRLADNLPRILVDKGQIQQALINLALNAIEATDPGGLLLFTTRYNDEDKQIEINVRDSGSGIPPDIIDNIFDPFFTTKEDGNGLGLAITHGIIEQHGGTLGVENQFEEGTCFCIKLPVDTGKQHADSI